MAAQLERGQGLASTIARVILGVIFFAHGWQKFVTNGIDNVAASFEKMDVPLPTLSAWFAGIVELVGGAALIIGLAVPLVAVLGIIDMLGAIIFVHWDAGFFASNGGYELPLALIAGLIAVGIASHGPLAADTHLLKSRSKAVRQ
ncbi:MULTISPECIES: DoxX family protein [Tsukamurella]|uniref:DoxX family protein n=2 Tax=Tsukamurella TaxID=2060 RepID=A0A5C5S6D1_9ACTN|nr:MULTISPECIES: DoxX family protein [Tsukamurella]NMD55102.1 DoxX family protein [Tsukamurella columbiensis]TWS30128.1 DoxX family protein [Tsukamurella conjunctivitidis]